MNEFQIKTARLILRPMRQDDLDILSEIFANAEMMRFYPAPFTRQQTQGWIDWSIGSHLKRGHGLWAVDLNGKLIGDCGITLQKVDEEPFLDAAKSNA
jgi:RimJ/RimL family protein N-acetyltransferase